MVRLPLKAMLLAQFLEHLLGGLGASGLQLVIAFLNAFDSFLKVTTARYSASARSSAAAVSFPQRCAHSASWPILSSVMGTISMV